MTLVSLPFYRRPAFAVLVACLLVAMTTTAQTTSCDAAKAKGFAGKPFSPELAEEARQAAGAPLVRGVGPGMVSSADRRPNRLNVEVDKQQVVTGFRCE
jgi:hypothetical protein